MGRMGVMGLMSLSWPARRIGPMLPIPPMKCVQGDKKLTPSSTNQTDPRRTSYSSANCRERLFGAVLCQAASSAGRTVASVAASRWT